MSTQHNYDQARGPQFMVALKDLKLLQAQKYSSISNYLLPQLIYSVAFLPVHQPHHSISYFSYYSHRMKSFYSLSHFMNLINLMLLLLFLKGVLLICFLDLNKKTKLKKKIVLVLWSQIGVHISLLNTVEVNGLLQLQTKEGTIDVMYEDIKQSLFSRQGGGFQVKRTSHQFILIFGIDLF